MTLLVLCRHAREGEPQRLVDALRGIDALAVYTSPLQRARDTAAAVAAARGLTAVEADDLREIEFGDVDGLGFDELPPDLQRGLLEAPTRVRFPGGESYRDLQARVVVCLDNIIARHSGETVIAISHAGAIRAALAAWLLVPDEAVFRIDQRFAAVNVVEWLDGVPLVRLVNGSQP